MKKEKNEFQMSPKCSSPTTEWAWSAQKALSDRYHTTQYFSFGNHCMYYSQNVVITLITVFNEIVIIFVDWIDGMSLIKI